MQQTAIEILLGQIRGDVTALREIQEVRNVSILERIEEHERRMNERMEKLEASFSKYAVREHELNGAMWMLSLIGGGVLSVLGFIGYTAVHGIPQWVKRIFDGALSGT